MTNPAERLERSFAYHLARGSWLPSAVLKVEEKLPARPDAVANARHRLRDAVAHAVPEEELEILEVLVTELVANAIAHAGTDPDDTVVLHGAVAPARIRVEVCDDGAGFDPREIARPRRAPGGFGLLMVDRAASRWGVSADDGNCVWFELDRHPA